MAQTKIRLYALVTFQKGDSIRSRFTFETEHISELNESRINTLRIEFIDTLKKAEI